MVGDGLAEVVNIPAKHSCEQKAEEVLAPQKILLASEKWWGTYLVCSPDCGSKHSCWHEYE